MELVWADALTVASDAANTRTKNLAIDLRYETERRLQTTDAPTLRANMQTPVWFNWELISWTKLEDDSSSGSGADMLQRSPLKENYKAGRSAVYEVNHVGGNEFQAVCNYLLLQRS